MKDLFTNLHYFRRKMNICSAVILIFVQIKKILDESNYFSKKQTKLEMLHVAIVKL